MNRPNHLNTAEAADYIDSTVTTMAKWRCLNVGPTYIKIGHKVRYSVDDLNDWLDSQRIVAKAS